MGKKRQIEGVLRRIHYSVTKFLKSGSLIKLSVT